MLTQRPPTIDPPAALRWAAVVSQPSPWLHEEVARRMEERLQLITAAPKRWVHWEPLRGGLQAHALLAKRYPKSECFVVQALVDKQHIALESIATPWWRLARWRGARVHFGLPESPVDMLWANMALHMAPDPQALIAQWSALLATDGFLMFSCLGPDTLRELRSVYRQCGWPPPSHEFTDMHDWGDMLVQAGFAEPVMDRETVTLTFATPERLLQELRELGRNLHTQRFAGLRGRRWHLALRQALAALCRPQGGGEVLSLTFEIVYGHAFKPAPRHAVAAETRLSLDEMRAHLRNVNKKAADA
jgi:malonyl-CoA O-methyltransferase